MKFLNLNADILLTMTSYLPDRDKIKLSKMIRGVASQVLSCTINSGPGIDLVELARALQKFENVRKVTITELGWGWSAGTSEQDAVKKQIMKLIAVVNPTIEEFVFDTPGTSIDDVAVYIEAVKESDDEYDASNICNTFDVDTKSGPMLEYLLKKYPDLKLKLKLKLEPTSLYKRSTVWALTQKHLVTDLTIRSTAIIEPDEYPSVTKLALIDSGGSPSDCLRKCVNGLPLLTDVDICVNVNNVSFIFEQLISIANLKSLKFKCDKYLWTNNNFETFGKLLAKDTLNTVLINTLRGNHLGILSELTHCPKSNFRSFLVRSEMFVAFNYQNHCLELKKPLFKEISIIDLVSKFKKVRILSIDVEDQLIAKQIRDQFSQILSKRPRNATRLDLKLNLPKSYINEPFPFLID